jgi:hypothetical protein
MGMCCPLIADKEIEQWKKDFGNTCTSTYSDLRTDGCTKFEWLCPPVLTTWQIVLTAIGGAVFIGLCVLGCYCCCCRRKTKVIIQNNGASAQPAYNPNPNGAFKAV